MTSTDQARKLFLLGSLILGVLIVGGLVLAVFSPSDTTIAHLTFNDDHDPIKGPAESALTVHIFGDLQCPACKTAEVGLQYAMKTYGDKVRFVWNDFPLQSLHLNAFLAANAARCAESQGKFWEFHDRLYEDQASWADLPDPKTKFEAYAQGLGLDASAFSSCLNEQKYKNKITDDQAEGNRNGVDATPTFFIGDTKFTGSLQNDAWDKEIQAQLTAKK